MLSGRRLHRYTYADYVALERASPTKHEFLDGEIYAMAGGSEEHSALAAEVLRALGNALGDRPCRVHTSDLRIYVEDVGLATFPDGAVVCGPLEQHAPSPAATALNPRVLLEVTSASSEEYDTTTKLEAYRTIPSLRDYIQANGELGIFQDCFAVYDRASAPCQGCGRPIVKLVQAGRATYMCRRCQR